MVLPQDQGQLISDGGIRAMLGKSVDWGVDYNDERLRQSCGKPSWYETEQNGETSLSTWDDAICLTLNVVG